MYNTKRAFSLLEKISFVRTGGSKEELKAANILKEEIEKTGTEAWLEEFPVDHSEVELVKLEITAPYHEELECVAVKMTGDTPKEGIEAELIYIQDADDCLTRDIEGKIVLINGRMIHKLYKKMIDKKPAAFISFAGSVYDDPANSDLDVYPMREKQYEMGKIPGVGVRALTAQNIIRNHATKAKITLTQHEGKRNSRNVVCEIKGTTYPNEVIALTAHYDSVPYSNGAYDNASGSVGIMELFHHFLENKPARTLRFVWCGSEEMGLLGSRAYVAAHEEELKNYVFNLNIDMIGVILGKEIACSTAENSLVSYIDYVGKEVGVSVASYQGVYSSDSTPFADKGVPATSFCRASAQGGATIHSRKDVLDHMSHEAFDSSLKLITAVADRLVNAHTFPIPRNIPDNMKLELDYYNLRKERPGPGGRF